MRSKGATFGGCVALLVLALETTRRGSTSTFGHESFIWLGTGSGHPGVPTPLRLHTARRLRSLTVGRTSSRVALGSNGVEGIWQSVYKFLSGSFVMPKTLLAASREDPGRPEVASEFFSPGGELLLRIPLEGSGSLVVNVHKASEDEALPGMPAGSKQQWRVLSFESSDKLVQAVSKVCVAPPDSSHRPSLLQNTDCLALYYTKSMVSVTLATLRAMGRLPLPEEEAAGNGGRPRFLAIGLGAGSVPGFLAAKLPHCHVDVVELEDAVLRASRAMGFDADRPEIDVIIRDGATFALEAAERIAGGAQEAYDAVLVDAYDGDGYIPPPFCEAGGALARALEQGLLKDRGGVVVTNIIPELFPDVHSTLRAHKLALSDRGAALAFYVRANPRIPSSGNFITVQTCGVGASKLPEGLPEDELCKVLREAGRELTERLETPFDMGEVAVRSLRTYAVRSL